jgi:hypothetical protein
MELGESGGVLLALAFALALWIRNVSEMSAIHRLALRVQRKWYRLALLHSFVSKLNTEVVAQAQKKDVPVKEGPAEPAYWSSIMSRESKRSRHWWSI